MRWFFAPLPATRVAALRMLVGLFATTWLVVRSPALIGPAFWPPGPWTPVGLLALLDPWLEAPSPVLVVGAWLLAVAAGVAFTIGLRFPVSAPIFATLLTLLGTYRCSFAQINHTEHLLVIHVWVLALSPAADCWSVDAAHGRHVALDRTTTECDAETSRSEGYGWPVRSLIVLTALAYVIAGAAKLRIAGMDWGDGEVLRVHVAWDNLRKIELGDAHSPLGAWLVQYAWPWSLMGRASLMLEFAAPLALVHERLGRAWAFCMWTFHLGVAAIMFILFAYPLSGVAFACLLRPEQSPRLERLGRWLEGSPSMERNASPA